MATYNAVQIEHRENLKNKIFRQLDISKYFNYARDILFFVIQILSFFSI